MRTPLPLLLLAACNPDPVDSGNPEPPLHVDFAAGCDPLVPEYCGYPYPSDAWLVADTSSATGLRMAIPQEAIPDPPSGAPFDTEPYERLDGFTAAPQLLALFPAPPDLSGMAGQDDIGRSLEDDSPTVVLDLVTGERMPHWAELDVKAEEDSERTLYLRLARRLTEGHRYGVALRGLVDADGAPIEPSEAFTLLRDGVITDDAALEARRPSYHELFDLLEHSDIPREGLTLAWWFQVASSDTIHGDLLAMRADALQRLGGGGLGCTIATAEDGYGGDGRTFRRVTGTYTVPWYLDSDEAPSRIVRDEDGLPAFQGTREVGFSLIIPQSVADAGQPGPLVTFGHGLMGDADEYLTWGTIRDIAQRGQAVMVATDWAGMCTDDATAVAQAIIDPSLFVTVAERLEQGMINQIALTRTFAGLCSDVPEVRQDGLPLIDPTRRYFVGVSQGGILGATLAAVSPDIDRAALLVNGGVFPFMIERSIDFVPYLPLWESAYTHRLDQVFLLTVSEELWEHAEGAGYLASLHDGLGDLEPKQVLSISAKNDAQVPNLATDWAMRTAGMPMIRGSAREPWGVSVVDAPWQGSGGFTMDWGDAPVPTGNEAPAVDDGGHWYVPTSDLSLQVILHFFETGEILMPCDGTCDPD
ncbi:MAG: hypothetical protein ABIO70_05035 [Pseudomonadota bacterium]